MTLISRLRAILLVLVLLPLLTVATTPRAASARTTDHYLELVSLKCIDTQDLTGPDEPYLLIFDPISGLIKNQVWPLSLNNGQTVDLTSKPATKFESAHLHVALWDIDTADSKNWLGTNIIPVTDAGLGNRTVSFIRDGAHYELTYYVH